MGIFWCSQRTDVKLPWKVYLSQRADNAQRTQIIPYFADLIYETLYKKSIKPDINSSENSVDPDKPADQDPHTVFHTTWHCEVMIIN